MNDISILPLAWAGVIAFCIVLYVILDGFTLGTALLMPFMNEQERDLGVSVILPTWDGNQTWLVLGGASLYGGFPLAFSAILPVLYLPILALVTSLLFRGVVFEFRLKSAEHKHHWDVVFVVASLVVTIVQGIILGNFVEGFDIIEQPLIYSANALLTPFSIFTGFALVAGYMLLGSTRLIYKTEGELQQKMFSLAPKLALLVMVAMGIVSAWTPFQNAHVFTRWFSRENWLLLIILPYVSVITFGVFLFAIRRREEHLPFLCSIAIFICAYIGVGISLFPYIIPYRVTIWEAAAPTGSLHFLMVGTIIMLPVLIVYTGYSYQIFKGKVKNVFHY